MTRGPVRLLAAPCLLALVLTSCSSSSAKRPAAEGAPSSATPTASAGGAATASAAPTATRSTASASPTAATATAPPATHRATASPAARSGSSGTAVQGTAPGTYTYDTSGTVKTAFGPKDASGTTTFTVSALAGGSQHTQMKSTNSTTDEQVVPRSAGMFLSDLKINGGGGIIDVEFRLSPAALLFPSAATTGKTWSWKATSTDGKTTATQSSKVTGTQTLVIGGKKVSTVVVQTHLVLSGGTDYTVDVTNWVAPSYRLVVKDHQVGHGTAYGSSYSNDITDVLRSVRPA